MRPATQRVPQDARAAELRLVARGHPAVGEQARRQLAEEHRLGELLRADDEAAPALAAGGERERKRERERERSGDGDAAAHPSSRRSGARCASMNCVTNGSTGARTSAGERSALHHAPGAHEDDLVGERGGVAEIVA